MIKESIDLTALNINYLKGITASEIDFIANIYLCHTLMKS